MRLQPTLASESLVFVDECSISTALNSEYAWSKRGEPVTLFKPRYGQRRTLVGAIGQDGRRALSVLDKGVKVETWLDFVDHHLVPMLREGDVVVMDNLRAHHNAAGIARIEATGATVQFQPAYSPEFNAIELCWGWVKHELRHLACRNISRLVESALKRWASVTPELCSAWTRGCGYAVA